MSMLAWHAHLRLLFTFNIGILWLHRKEVMKLSIFNRFSFIFRHGRSRIVGISDDRIEGKYFLHDVGVELYMVS